jgi:hypothetical protein
MEHHLPDFASVFLLSEHIPSLQGMFHALCRGALVVRGLLAFETHVIWTSLSEYVKALPCGGYRDIRCVSGRWYDTASNYCGIIRTG